MMGVLPRARENLEQALAIGHFVLPGGQPFLASDTDARVSLLMYLHHCLFLLGWPDQARSAAQQAMAERPAQLYSVALLQALTCRAHLLEREAGHAADSASVLYRIADERGYPHFLGSATVYRGWTLARDGRTAEGVELCRSGIEQLRAIGTSCSLPFNLALLAECHALAGQIDQALSVLDDALALIRRTQEHVWESEICRLTGEFVLRWKGAHSEAEAHLRRAVDIAHRQEARIFALRAATALANLLNRTGRTEESRNILGPTYEWFTEGFDCVDVREAKRVLDAPR
jgi:predicted ATPase